MLVSLDGLARVGQVRSKTGADILKAKLREELDQGYHIYQQCKKVWAQKPLERKRKRRRGQEDG